MIGAIAKAIFGSSNDRYVKSLDKIVKQINAFEPTIEALSDEELTAQTDKFRRLLDGGKDLDDILPEAFATVREAARRVLGMRHFDVQMIGGIVLHRGEGRCRRSSARRSGASPARAAPLRAPWRRLRAGCRQGPCRHRAGGGTCRSGRSAPRRRALRLSARKR